MIREGEEFIFRGLGRIKNGDRFRHYKGNIYTVTGGALHTEDQEDLIIYENEQGGSFARPAAMFFEEVIVNEEMVNRFTKIDE